jgi:hypothetical protein
MFAFLGNTKSRKRDSHLSLFYSSRYTQGYENGLTFATIKVNSVPSSCVYQSVIIAQIIMNNTILACASETIRVIWIHHYIRCLPFNYAAVSFRTGCWTHGSWVQTSASIRFLQPLACWFETVNRRARTARDRGHDAKKVDGPYTIDKTETKVYYCTA